MMRSCRLLAPFLPLLVVALVQAGCKKDDAATVIMTVLADESLAGVSVAQIDVQVTAGMDQQTQTYTRTDGKPISFPTTLTAQVGEAADSASIQLSAKDGHGAQLGAGSAMAPLVIGQSTVVVITLTSAPAKADGGSSKDAGPADDGG